MDAVREMLPEKPPIPVMFTPGCMDHPWLTTMFPPMGFEIEKSDPAGKTLTMINTDLDTVPLVPTTVIVKFPADTALVVDMLSIDFPAPPMDSATEEGVGEAAKAPVFGLTVVVRLTVPLKPCVPVRVIVTVVEVPASMPVVEGLEAMVKSGLGLLLRPNRDLACGRNAIVTVTRLAATSAMRVIATRRLLTCKTLASFLILFHRGPVTSVEY